MIAPGYLVLHVLHVLHVFLMFPFLFQELKELGKEVDKLKKVCFFFLNVCDHETKIFCWELCAARRRKIFLH